MALGTIIDPQINPQPHMPKISITKPTSPVTVAEEDTSPRTFNHRTRTIDDIDKHGPRKNEELRDALPRRPSQAAQAPKAPQASQAPQAPQASQSSQAFDRSERMAARGLLELHDAPPKS
ncbi:hypothetical protein RSP795_17755 [Ralstonia solanacearum]|uniref:hypothetical protein n=1 Tax=Ralstonia solanacearum TaxID=305 RepID=UPI0007D75EDD|nr:hypothetical protein [Ralstonia solanacearum]OAI60526.1 hypothetical protein RSP795_17755 [Ralstonia solanacearum]